MAKFSSLSGSAARLVVIRYQSKMICFNAGVRLKLVVSNNCRLAIDMKRSQALSTSISTATIVSLLLLQVLFPLCLTLSLFAQPRYYRMLGISKTADQAGAS